MEMGVKSCVYAFVFARGGSKGIPRKNLRHLAGKPLIAYAINTGLKSEIIDRVFVSTEDHEIANVSKQYGAEIAFMRPTELAQDNSPEWFAWRHAVLEIQKNSNITDMEVFVSLPPTSPLRTVADVEKCIITLMKSDADIVITARKAMRHPSFNMITCDKNGYARLLMPMEKPVYRRQDTSMVYDMTTVSYVTRPEYIIKANSIFEGKVKAVFVPEERALDIDTELDFSFAEFLTSKIDVQ
ncbi:cytidylyltransferase domain-containing protein [Thermodesulfobacteriota bacterium]